MHYKTLNILIFGTGGIGIRHIEALLSIPKNIKLNFFISDINIEALNFAKKYIKEKRSNVSIYNFLELDEIEKNIDLTIIATTSFPRFEIIESLLEKGIKGYFLLEKLIAPNFTILNDYIDLFSKYESASKIFVNQWYYAASTFNCILKNSPNPKSILLKGNGWGMACNAVHYISLFEQLFCTRFHCLDSHLEIVESKRKPYKELIGVIILRSNSDINFTISCNQNEDKSKLRSISVYSEKNNYLYKYDGQFLQDELNEKVYKMPYLSSFLKNIYNKTQISKEIVQNFVPLKDSIRNHQCLFNAIEKSSLSTQNYFT